MKIDGQEWDFARAEEVVRTMVLEDQGTMVRLEIVRDLEGSTFDALYYRRDGDIWRSVQAGSATSPTLEGATAFALGCVKKIGR